MFLLSQAWTRLKQPKLPYHHHHHHQLSAGPLDTSTQPANYKTGPSPYTGNGSSSGSLMWPGSHPVNVPDLQIDAYPGATFRHAEVILDKAIVTHSHWRESHPLLWHQQRMSKGQTDCCQTVTEGIQSGQNEIPSHSNRDP